MTEPIKPRPMPGLARLAPAAPAPNSPLSGRNGFRRGSEHSFPTAVRLWAPVATGVADVDSRGRRIVRYRMDPLRE